MLARQLALVAVCRRGYVFSGPRALSAACSKRGVLAWERARVAACSHDSVLARQRDFGQRACETARFRSSAFSEQRAFGAACFRRSGCWTARCRNSRTSSGPPRKPRNPGNHGRSLLTDRGGGSRWWRIKRRTIKDYLLCSLPLGYSFCSFW